VDRAFNAQGGSASRNSSLGKPTPRRLKPTLAEDLESSQIQAIEALIASMGLGTPLAQLSSLLIKETLDRHGEKPFTEDFISKTLESVLDSRAVSSPSGLRDPDEAAKRVSLHSTREIAKTIVQLLRELAKEMQLPFTDIAGQLLWRNRDAEPLKVSPHKSVVEDFSWVAEPQADGAPTVLDHCATVFRELTIEDGRMKWKAWTKVVELMRRNPVLAPRINRNDVDRLFHAEATKALRRMDEDKRDSIGMSVGLMDYMGMLFNLCGIIKVHPYMIFLAVGCHAHHLVDQRMMAEAAGTVRAGPGSRAASSRGASRSRPGSAGSGKGRPPSAGSRGSVPGPGEALGGPS